MLCAVGNDEDLRRAAIWLLGFVPEPADLDLLTQAAKDSDEGIRNAAVGTLGSRGKEPAVIDLLSNLLDDPSSQGRISGLSSLSFLQQPKMRHHGRGFPACLTPDAGTMPR
ncbi:HEAT repeat domain-containing protein [Streptomyces sp. NPDC002886]|uniref:HEAT repeat domain-containing protein n=1 Tax=Streptomyces sp. NPDC002886 TaxID=3364667 RepID=UPI0036ABC972